MFTSVFIKQKKTTFPCKKLKQFRCKYNLISLLVFTKQN